MSPLKTLTEKLDENNTNPDAKFSLNIGLDFIIYVSEMVQPSFVLNTWIIDPHLHRDMIGAVLFIFKNMKLK